MVEGRNRLFENRIKVFEGKIDIAREALEYHENQAENLKETIEIKGEEQEEQEELLKQTKEELTRLKLKREAQMLFWKNIYTSRVLYEQPFPKNKPKSRLTLGAIHEQAFRVKDDGCRMVDPEDTNNLERTVEETENELQKTAETSYEAEIELEYVEKNCIPYHKLQLETLQRHHHNEMLRKERMNFYKENL